MFYLGILSLKYYVKQPWKSSANFVIGNILDLELTIDPAPPRGNFRDYDFLIPYGM